MSETYKMRVQCGLRRAMPRLFGFVPPGLGWVKDAHCPIGQPVCNSEESR